MKSENQPSGSVVSQSLEAPSLVNPSDTLCSPNRMLSQNPIVRFATLDRASEVPSNIESGRPIPPPVNGPRDESRPSNDTSSTEEMTDPLKCFEKILRQVNADRSKQTGRENNDEQASFSRTEGGESSRTPSSLDIMRHMGIENRTALLQAFGYQVRE